MELEINTDKLAHNTCYCEIEFINQENISAKKLKIGGVSYNVHNILNISAGGRITTTMRIGMFNTEELAHLANLITELKNIIDRGEQWARINLEKIEEEGNE